MTQTIEQLTARVRDLEEQYELAANLANTSMDRVRELEEENARLVSAIDEHMVVSHIGVFNRGDDPKDALNKIACYEQGIGEYFGKELRDQLAASQAYAEQLLEALEKLATIANQYAGHYPYQVATIVDAALSLPADTSALDAYVAAKVKEAGKFDMWKTNPYTKVLETSIEQLTKQRDLAVEALEKWDMFFGGDAETAVLTIAEDPSTLTGCQKATKEAMSAIKESEAK